MTISRERISDNKDWCTPPKYINLINKYFDDDIDLDPCSNVFSMVDAKIKYMLPMNGLTESWNYKNIYVNPPYGRYKGGTTIYDWLKKGLAAHVVYKSTILFLIPVATNTKHYKEVIFKNAIGICFLADTRLRFYNNGEEYKKGSPMACAMILFGDDEDYIKFEEIFKSVGYCIKLKKGI